MATTTERRLSHEERVVRRSVRDGEQLERL